MTLFNKKITVIVPAFNEERTITEVVKKLKSYSDEVIVIDDSSSDKTREYALRAGAIVVSHNKNQGYDASIEDGFQEAVSQGADILVTFDADGQHDPADIKRVAEPLISGEADLVVTQRSGTRHFSEKIFGLYTQLRYGIKDPLSGLKAYSKEVYRTIGHFDTIKSTGTQLMIEALSRGFRLKIVPIQIKPRLDQSRFYSWSIRGECRILKSMIKVIIKTVFRPGIIT